jgi:hypothetical protein
MESEAEYSDDEIPTGGQAVRPKQTTTSGNMTSGGSVSGNARSAGGASAPGTRQSDQEQQRVAAVEGVNSEVEKYLDGKTRHTMRWSSARDRFQELCVDEEWKPWGHVADNKAGHLLLRERWLTWMACTSKLLQTVDNKHLNRHLDYLYAGPTVNFVDLQSTPHIGRRLQILAHFVECINNLGEFPLDCVVPTPETEILFGRGKGSKLVRGMRMKTPVQRVSRELELTSTARCEEKWLKSFRRGEPRPRPRPRPRPVYHIALLDGILL